MATRSETSKSFEKFRKNLISARTARRIGGVAIFVIAWQLAADAGIPGIENVPKPSAWIAESIDYVQTEDYYLSVLGSMRRVASGYVHRGILPYSNKYHVGSFNNSNICCTCSELLRC